MNVKLHKNFSENRVRGLGFVLDKIIVDVGCVFHAVYSQDSNVFSGGKGGGKGWKGGKGDDGVVAQVQRWTINQMDIFFRSQMIFPEVRRGKPAVNGVFFFVYHKLYKPPCYGAGFLAMVDVRWAKRWSSWKLGTPMDPWRWWFPH